MLNPTSRLSLISADNTDSAAKAFGIPQANEQNVLCFPMACIRTAKIGLSILALSFQGQRKAAGTVLALVGLVAGPSDAWMCWENGGPQWKVHLMASALCGTVGWMMAR